MSGNRNERQTKLNRCQQPAIVDKCDADALDNDFSVSSLNVMPPTRTYTTRVCYHFVGHGRPLPYDFDDVFDEET